MKLCTHPPCSEPVVAKGLCKRHYYQRRSGRALTMPDLVTADENHRIAEQWKQQGSACASCHQPRRDMRIHLHDDDAVCDLCAALLQISTNPALYDDVALYLLDRRAQHAQGLASSPAP